MGKCEVMAKLTMGCGLLKADDCRLKGKAGGIICILYDFELSRRT